MLPLAASFAQMTGNHAMHVPWLPRDGEMATRIRNCDWARTPLGRIEDWRSCLKVAVQLVLAQTNPTCIIVRPGNTLIYNDAYAAKAGFGHPDVLGMDAERAFAEVKFANSIRRAMNGETFNLSDAYMPFRRYGAMEPAWFDVNYSPARDETGEVFAVLISIKETTARVQVERALRESEARLATAFKTLPVGVAIVDPGGRVVMFNDEMRNFLPTGKMPSRDPENLGRWKAYAKDGSLIPTHDYPTTRALRGDSVVPGIEMLFTRKDGREVWTRVASAPLRDPEGRITGAFSVAVDIDQLKRTEEAIRTREERQGFLLKFSDTLRLATDENTVANLAVRLLATELGLDECHTVSVHPAEDRAYVTHQYGNGEVPPMAAVIRLSDFPAAFRQTLNQTVVFNDTATDPALTGLDRQSIAAMHMGALVAAPIRRGEGNPIWGIVAVMAKPRRWTPEDVALVEEVAERTWAAMERARAEKALRESETLFRQFGEAAADALWIRNAETLAIEYANPAMETAFGIPREVIEGDPRAWLAVIIPDDRDEVQSYIARVRAGEPVVHEYRILRPSDRHFRWIHSTGFPIYDGSGQVRRIGGIASDVTQEKLLGEHQGVLLAELQHRVRNIMAIIRSIAVRTGKTAASVQEYADAMAGRLLTLARVQALLTRAANVGVKIATIVEEEITAQAQHADQYTMAGPDIVLSPKAAEVLTLALHELATNAIKYGALSSSAGHITVTWKVIEKRGAPWLSFDWNEQGGPAHAPSDAPRRRGFGSELIEARIPYELGGLGHLEIGPGGAQCHMEFPLNEGPSILETAAPQRAGVLGGALDMTGQANLSGQRILVVEDDYYLANDTVRALRGAGANVLGPCSKENAALENINVDTPTGAVVDINLGEGPSFKLAKTLKQRAIPFVFITGYDEHIIPEDFADAPRLQKPVDLKHIVNTLAAILPAPRA